MNTFGIFCEGLLKEILAEAGIPHKKNRRGDTYYWWANRFEDKRLGVDCWVSLPGQGEIPIDFTVISSRKPELLNQKAKTCLGRGVIPIVLEAGVIRRAVEENGSSRRGRFLDEIGQEIRGQIAAKWKLLKVPPMPHLRYYPPALLRERGCA